MERSETYRMIAARLGSAVNSAKDATAFEVGDWVQWIPHGMIEAYGGIRSIANGKAKIASAEGLVTAPLDELRLVRKAR